MMKVETVVELLKKDIDYIKGSLDENKKEHKDIVLTIERFIEASNKNQNEFIKKADEKYASKEYETVVKSTIALMLTILISAIVWQVIK